MELKCNMNSIFWSYFIEMLIIIIQKVIFNHLFSVSFIPTTVIYILQF